MTAERDRGIVIVGAGGFGRETLDAALAAGMPVTAFADDRELDHVRGLPVTTIETVPAGHRYVVAVADTDIRGRLVQRAEASGLHPATVIHPRAVVGPETTIAAGCVILALAHISSSVTLYEHVQVNYLVSIGHDTLLEPRSTILPGANIGGSVTIGKGALIGSGAVILQRLRVQARAVVGAGAVVTRDVMAGTTVIGSPARRIDPRTSA